MSKPVEFHEVELFHEAEDQIADAIVARIYKDVPDDFYDVAGMVWDLFDDVDGAMIPFMAEVSDAEFSEIMGRHEHER